MPPSTGVTRKLSTRGVASLLGEADAVRELRARIAEAARTDFPVLLEGETGTGKDLAAWLLHAGGPRAARPFVVVNCAALPEHLFESELFGHARGAFSGATTSKPGLIEGAEGGTLFLDEIGELSGAAQAKLLRVLETGTFQRLGSVEPLQMNARIVAATNRDLAAEVAGGNFRADLFYRLRVITLRMPPLRERRCDIPILARHFLERIARRHGLVRVDLADDALAALRAYVWPGNARELLHTLENAVVQARGERITVAHLPPDLRAVASTRLAFDQSSAAWARQELEGVLLRTGWNVTEAARQLRISRRRLTEKLARLGLRRPPRT